MCIVNGIRLQNSMVTIPELAHAIQQGQLDEASKLILQIAGYETKVYTELSELTS
jgi:hypothetical protein